MLPLAILVGGQLLVLLIGQIDLSVTAVMATGSIVSASILTRQAADLGDPAATATGILACLAVGTVIGLFNGVCNAILRVPSFIVMLAVMMDGNGAAVWYASNISDTLSVGGLPESFRHIGYGTAAGIPIALILSVSVLTGIHYILSRTVTGQAALCRCHNAAADRISGVPALATVIWPIDAREACESESQRKADLRDGACSLQDTGPIHSRVTSHESLVPENSPPTRRDNRSTEIVPELLWER